MGHRGGQCRSAVQGLVWEGLDLSPQGVPATGAHLTPECTCVRTQSFCPSAGMWGGGQRAEEEGGVSRSGNLHGRGCVSSPLSKGGTGPGSRRGSRASRVGELKPEATSHGGPRLCGRSALSLGLLNTWF